MRFKPWQIWVLRVTVRVLIVGTIILVALTSPAATTVAVVLRIVALVSQSVRDAIRQRPKLTLRASTAGSNMTEQEGVRVARVAIQLGLHNEGGEARSWKVEITTTTAGALNLFKATPPLTDNVIQRKEAILWQSAPGEPLAHDAERQLDLITEFFPIASGLRAKLVIKADRATSELRLLEVRTAHYSSTDAEFDALILDPASEP